MKKIILFAVFIIVAMGDGMEAQNLLPHKVGDKYGYSTVPDQRMIIRPQFEDAFNFSEGLAPVVIDSKFGFIDSIGNVKIAAKYDDAFEFQKGKAVVVVEGKYGIINRVGKILLPTIFDKLGPYDGVGAWGVYEGTKGYVVRLSSEMLVFRTRDGELYLRL